VDRLLIRKVQSELVLHLKQGSGREQGLRLSLVAMCGCRPPQTSI
jgi:hypothetical protein